MMGMMSAKQRIRFYYEGEAEKCLDRIRDCVNSGNKGDAKFWKNKYVECRQILAELENDND